MGQAARRRVAVLGSTGSIGVQALDIIDHFPDRFEVVALAAGRNVDLLARQVRRHRPKLVAIVDEERRSDLRPEVRDAGGELMAGREGIWYFSSFLYKLLRCIPSFLAVLLTLKLFMVSFLVKNSFSMASRKSL